MSDRCDDCRFGTPVGLHTVVCRRFPPHPVAVLGERFDPGDTLQGYWPRVGADDSCGEFRAAPPHDPDQRDAREA
jgi:hypothetical protein